MGEHLKVKGNEGVGEMLGDQAEAIRCCINAVRFRAVRVVASSHVLPSMPMDAEPSSSATALPSESVPVVASKLSSQPGSSDFGPRIESPDAPCLQPVEKTVPVQLVPGHPDRVTFTKVFFFNGRNLNFNKRNFFILY